MVGLLAVRLPAQGPALGKPCGSIAGLVASSAGIPQMGATVLLFDRFDRVAHRAFTDETGSFLFEALAPGSYSLRVSLASFFPALKRSILVQPGMRSLFNVNLAGVLSTIELVYSATGSGAIMSDDWKWVLRSSSATRPILRFRPRIDLAEPANRRAALSTPFSETRGMVRISAGEEGRVSQYGNEPDLGTAFALATSLFGNNQVQVSGNFGYSTATGIPAAAFSTSYSRGSPGKT
ncbi:MAG: carboxypeptidase-like regulatory domain-containing protein, partial [Acidobacteria bacterium]|nr:carboxypeptidase-like regulatory domain-containing protein [Acidobacteriota bacterium]